MSGESLGMRPRASAATAKARSAGSSERSSNRSCETRIVWMLRTRSPWKSAASPMSSSYMTAASERGGRGSAAALEIQIAPDREQPLEALLHQLERRALAETPVGRRYPAVGEVAVLGKKNPQGLVDAKQMARAREQVRVVGKRLAPAIAGDGGGRLRGEIQQRRLVSRRQLPVHQQRW